MSSDIVRRLRRAHEHDGLMLPAEAADCIQQLEREIDHARNHVAELELERDQLIAEHEQAKMEIMGRGEAIDQFERENAALQADLAKAREALEPFSVMSGVYEGHEDKDPVLAVISKGERINVTVGDFRRAREVYRALQHKERETGACGNNVDKAP